MDKNYTKLKKKIYTNCTSWEDILEEDIRKIFIFKMFEQGYAPKSLDVSDYLPSDSGVAYIENYFSNSQIKIIRIIEGLDEDEFAHQKEVGADFIMRLLEEI